MRARQLFEAGEIGVAQALAEQALAEDDQSADCHSLIASILDRRGEWVFSLAHRRRAHALMPAAPQVRLNLAMALLRNGNYAEGLTLYESRLDKPAWSGFATAESRAARRDRLLRPGDPVAGRRIVLLAEQGLGDGIMCARYIPMLAEREARIAVACNPTLRPFFARVRGVETLLSPPPDQPMAQINLDVLPFDAWVPLLSLPHWFGTDLTTVPADIPYWHPHAARVAFWKNEFAAAGRSGLPKVGLVFQANPLGAGFADKSMRIADLTPLLAFNGIDFVNLQYGPAGRELAAATPYVLDPLRAELPLDDYGAAIAATDGLLTVDTMAAHLAGAMGHSVWIAVAQSPHWVWGLGEAATPWYPRSRIFRAHKDRDWSRAVAALGESLQATFARAHHTFPQTIASSAANRGNVNCAADEAAQFDLALAQLRREEFVEGFANYEARLETPLWREQGLPLHESFLAVAERRLRPGDAVRGRRIVVFTEQGLGDIFLGARFLTVLAERGAAITLICRAPMRPFFARLGFLDGLLSPPEEAPHAKIDLRRLAFDAVCPLLSLPHVLGIGSEGVTARAAYLSADPTQASAWRDRYARLGRQGHRKIGVVWRANPANVARSNRSLRAEDVVPLAALDGVDLVNLQDGPAGRELVRLAPQLIDATQSPLVLDEFAAALAATDLVVSVDTMAAHCAGAIGHPAFVLLPDDPGWWWGLKGDHSTFYSSARLFRRAAGAPWSSALQAAIAAALEVSATRP
ncbi:MAG: hypothetical protein WAV27_21985 [Xanthobacteraceae bacterium]